MPPKIPRGGSGTYAGRQSNVVCVLFSVDKSANISLGLTTFGIEYQLRQWRSLKQHFIYNRDGSDVAFLAGYGVSGQYDFLASVMYSYDIVKGTSHVRERLFVSCSFFSSTLTLNLGKIRCWSSDR